MTPSKETTEAPINPKEMKIYELSDKEFRIILLRKFRDRQINESRKTVQEQNISRLDKEIVVLGGGMGGRSKKEGIYVYIY